MKCDKFKYEGPCEEEDIKDPELLINKMPSNVDFTSQLAEYAVLISPEESMKYFQIAQDIIALNEPTVDTRSTIHQSLKAALEVIDPKRFDQLTAHYQLDMGFAHQILANKQNGKQKTESLRLGEKMLMQGKTAIEKFDKRNDGENAYKYPLRKAEIAYFQTVYEYIQKGRKSGGAINEDRIEAALKLFNESFSKAPKDRAAHSLYGLVKAQAFAEQYEDMESTQETCRLFRQHIKAEKNDGQEEKKSILELKDILDIASNIKRPLIKQLFSIFSTQRIIPGTVEEAHDKIYGIINIRKRTSMEIEELQALEDQEDRRLFKN